MALISDRLPNIFHGFSKDVCLAPLPCDLDSVNITTVVYFVLVALVVLVENAQGWNSSLETLDASIQVGAVSALDGGMACLWTARPCGIYDMRLGAVDAMHRRRRRGRGGYGLLHRQVRLEGPREGPVSLRKEGGDSI